MTRTTIQLLFVLCFVTTSQAGADSHQGSCSSFPDPALKEMNYTVQGVHETFLAYVEPNIATFYQKDPRLWSMKKIEPEFDGGIGKFMNLGRDPVKLFVKNPPLPPAAIGFHPNDFFLREIAPLSSQCFTCFPGQIFYLTPTNATDVLVSWKMTGNRKTDTSSNDKNRLHVYDPYVDRSEEILSDLSVKERINYDRFIKVLEFSTQYEQFTGRSYLPNRIRQPVSRPMWNADYFGQIHSVMTRETHFVTLPSVYEYEPILERGRKRILKSDDPRILEEYRTPYQSTMNMTLKVLSCAPRVFEVPNFLSTVEVEHILEQANVRALKESEMGSDRGVQDSQRARTSTHTWMKREQTQIIDAIYRRAADLLQIDEAFLRTRDESEEDHIDAIGTRSIAEAAHLVHYAEGQQYAAHQDWISPNVERPHQANRFATLLLYLNDDMVGGETSFPVWANAKNAEELKIIPEIGKAILFYNLLPDGNMDELSVHAAHPVIKGEKWIINLWIWDPLLQAK